MIPFPNYVDSSMRNTWAACKRKSLWSTTQALYPMGKSVHLIAGAAIAAGLEAARKRVFLDPNPSSVTLDDMLYAAYSPYLREWGGFKPDESSTKNFHTSWFALNHYLEQHNPYTDDLQPYIRPDNTPAVEYKFAVPIDDLLHPDTGDPILFAGRFDMIGLYSMPDGSKLMVIDDEKTTGSLTYDWATKWDMRGQFLGYIWALRQQGFQISHAVVRGIAILKTKNETRTAIVHYPDHLISRWERQFKRDVKDMITAYRYYRGLDEVTDPAIKDYLLEGHYPYAFGDACESYGGCAFASLCTAKDATPFTSNFIRHRFNPLERQAVEEIPNG